MVDKANKIKERGEEAITQGDLNRQLNIFPRLRSKTFLMERLALVPMEPEGV